MIFIERAVVIIDSLRQLSYMGEDIDIEDPLVKKRPVLNPYYCGAEMILLRLLWDLNIQSWISRWKISKWKNKYSGQKAIILCNGPSLNDVDFEQIERVNYFSFGLNKINLLFERLSFRPSCIVAVNSHVLEQNKEFYNQTEIPLFVDSVGIRKGWISPDRNVFFLHEGGGQNGFAKDCSMSINQGYTVTYVALQLAFHMGFENVALVGADHTFAAKGPANKLVEGGSKDESHFDPRYFASMEWQLPDLFESEVSYTRANNMYNAHDRKVFNCTNGGNLEIFRRLTLNEFIDLD